MILTLVIVAVLAVTLLVWLLRRDQTYLKKPLKEVVSEDMKKALNLRHAGAKFDSSLQKIQSRSDKSKDLLKEINKV